MADQKTRADSIREYHTGAVTPGGTQTNPYNSLGNYRSSFEVPVLGITRTSPVANITIDYASGGNALGNGSLDCTGVSSLRWKDAGGAYGAAVTILNGETKVLEASGNPGAFIRVTRTSATSLIVGTETVGLARIKNNFFGHDDVLSVEATGGDDEYYCSIIKNESTNDVTLFERRLDKLGTSRVSAAAQLGSSGGGTISISSGNLSDWPTHGWCQIVDNTGAERETVYYSGRTTTDLTIPDDAARGRFGTTPSAGAVDDVIHAVPGIEIAIDPAAVMVAGTPLQTIANENTPPNSVVWNRGIDAGDGIIPGTIAPGEEVGIWIHREIPVGAVAATSQVVATIDTFDAV